MLQACVYMPGSVVMWIFVGLLLALTQLVSYRLDIESNQNQLYLAMV